jgi:hypothetical protein
MTAFLVTTGSKLPGGLFLMPYDMEQVSPFTSLIYDLMVQKTVKDL